MAQSQRVIVTGNNTSGKSVVVEDVRVGITGPGNFDFWQTKAGQSPHDAAAGRAPMKFFPAPGGTMFRLFTIPPADPNMKPADIAAIQDLFFGAIGIPEARADTSRHPMMHVTPTVDYIVLLSGAISLQLDEGEAIALKPFDAVVQRATNHSWVNTEREPALLMCVMVGGT
ncbi:MAG: cupin domain-containing protein [Xanthobacteraceae bacterium]|nr:cupin domain-containing protein [Xanthobacteraceae bacterium]